jgi:4-aminobutyrate aminotransferase
MGKVLLDGLRSLQGDHPGLVDVRGLGLMVAAEFAHPDGSPDGKRAKNILHTCIDNGLLILTCGPHDNVLRLIPPLIVSEGQVRDGLSVLQAAVDASA